jgi:hypothetical protein
MSARSADAVVAYVGSMSAAPVLLPSLIVTGAGRAPLNITQYIQTAAGMLHCTSESCVLAHPDFRRHARAHGALSAVDGDLARRFKPPGPRNEARALHNFNIDNTLRLWARSEYPQFYPCEFAMMDFDRTGAPLSVVSIVDCLLGRVRVDGVPRVATTFACVVNTDVSSGGGKHWVVVFVDCRARSRAVPWTVEYFNSSGNAPPAAIRAWTERTRESLAEYRRSTTGGSVETVVVAQTRHQRSRTECGVYTLYYVRRRLEGAPYTDFAREIVADATMVEFRTHLFRSD